MGAGCYYTNEYYGKNDQKQLIKVVWLEVDPECEFDYQDSLDGLESHLKSILQVTYQNDKELQTPLYRITFEPTYYGDGIVIKQECLYDNSDYLEPDEIKLRNLANYNFERNYYSMINKLCKLGYTFRIATSSCTSGEYQQ